MDSLKTNDAASTLQDQRFYFVYSTRSSSIFKLIKDTKSLSVFDDFHPVYVQKYLSTSL